MELTPKQKAKELVDRFLNIEFEYNKDLLPKASLEKAKQCALICVGENIREFQTSKFPIGGNKQEVYLYYYKNDKYNYWQEVKNEIKNEKSIINNNRRF